MSSISVPTAVSSGSTLGTITNQDQFNSSYTQFLNMLTTELQNQDPTSPMDTTQFTDQLVGFSQLEQQLQTNSSLTTLVSDQKGATNSVSGSLGYLGHTVTATGDSLALDGEDPTTVSYSLPAKAAAATMTVLDANGQTVRTLTVPTNAGQNSLSFDGSGTNQDALPAGDYSFSISATDANGQPLTATTYTSGKVTGIDTSSGNAVLHLGDLSVNAADVVQVTA